MPDRFTAALSLSKGISRVSADPRGVLRQAQHYGIFLAVTFSAPVHAQSVVTSSEPEAVSLTVYRATNRGENPINKNWPQGYALITETRTVTIPAGDSVVRFEGVSEGMFPESAIVTGLPKGVREKNRDARLLSPQGLVDAYLKRQVTITRTNRATGEVRKQDAFITAGPSGGVILQTAEGYEALRCTGLPERMSYGGVPAGLSAKPTLSVMTSSDRPVTAKLTLTYMAAGFDWQANYVAQVQQRDATGKGKVDMFAWLTVANGGNQSFANANMMAIAGEPNRTRRGEQPRPTGGPLYISCWPMERTHEVPFRLAYELTQPPPPPPAYAPPPAPMYDMAVTVTGSRLNRDAKSISPNAVVVAEQENLGDLKLYRVPEPVTVNAKGQKQVAMLVKPGAAFEHYYAANVQNVGQQNMPLMLTLRGENKVEKGLGLPMPSGPMMIFEDSKYGPLLAGQSKLRDRAVGEEVEFPIASSPDVRMSTTMISESKKKQRWKIDLTNARNMPVNVEIEIPYELRGKTKGIAKVDGVPTWKGIVAANGEASFTYELKLGQD